MSDFRPYFIIQCRSSGLFLTESLGFTQLVTKAGRLYCPHSAVDTALNNLGSDYVIFSSYEIIEDNQEGAY